MSKGINKVLNETIKLDLITGLLISLLIVLSSSFLYAMIYFLGIIVGLLNYVCSYYVTNKMLFKGGVKSILSILITFARIFGVAGIAVLLKNDITFVVLYIFGFISYLVMLGISCIKNK